MSDAEDKAAENGGYQTRMRPGQFVRCASLADVPRSAVMVLARRP